MNSPRYRLNEQEHATILAALRYYQMQGLAEDPFRRPDVIDDIATRVDVLTSLDNAGIDNLCERLNTEEPLKNLERIREALRTAVRRAEIELRDWPTDKVDNAEHRSLRKALGSYQEAQDLMR